MLVVVVITFFFFVFIMSDEHVGHKENRLLQRGIFSTTDFSAFQKSEVNTIKTTLHIGNPASPRIHENMY